MKEVKGLRIAWFSRQWPLLPVLALALGVRLWFGPQVRDDAYITLRYAQNLLSGSGFVYNIGDRVLGTSTPLYTLVVAAVSGAGVEPPTVAVVIGILSDLVTIVLVYAIGNRLVSSSAGLLAAILYAIAAPVVAHSVSGMETPLYVAMTLATFLAWDCGRIPLASVLVGALAVLRPDGVLVGITLVFTEARRRRGVPWQMIAWAALVLVPWILFALIYFGSPVPQSMLAKVGLGGEDRWMSARHLLAYFTDLKERWFLPLTLASLIGLTTTGVRKPLARYLLAWAALYAAVFTLANKFLYPIMPFEWYFLPLLAPYVLLASFGLFRLVEHLKIRHASMATVGLTLVVLAVFLPVLARQRAELIKIVHGREALYVELALALSEYGAGQDLVAAPEIGALGYFYPGPILDVNGLVSPEAVGHSFSDLVYTRRPPWIVSYDTLIPDDLKQSAWFEREYRPVRQLMNWESRRATLYRRYPPPEEAEGRGIALGPLALLEGYRTEVQDLPTHRLLHVQIVWRAQEPLSERYTIFVHLFDENGNLIAQQDNEPQEGTRPTVSWKRGEIILDQFDLLVRDDGDLPDAVLEVGAYETDKPAGQTLGWITRGATALGPHLRLPALPVLPETTRCGVQFGRSILLQKARIGINKASGSAKVSLTWRALAAVDKDYTAFVHFLDEQGRLVAQHDARPLYGALPTSAWLPEDTVRDEHEVPITPSTLATATRIAVGMYDLQTGRRLTLGSNLGRDALILPLDMLLDPEQADDATDRGKDLDLCAADR